MTMKAEEKTLSFEIVHSKLRNDPVDVQEQGKSLLSDQNSEMEDEIQIQSTIRSEFEENAAHLKKEKHELEKNTSQELEDAQKKLQEAIQQKEDLEKVALHYLKENCILKGQVDGLLVILSRRMPCKKCSPGHSARNATRAPHRPAILAHLTDRLQNLSNSYFV